MSGTDLHRLTATAAVDLLRRGEVSPLELIDAAADRIAAVDGAVNALPTLCLDRARDQARRLMEQPAEARGVLAGLPVAIKDYNDLAGVRTTSGSPIFADTVPETSSHTVTALEAAGAIPVAKSNVPEFAGANTFNPVFGPTRNPWDTRMSVAGSSGGAAASLAAGMVWLAQGNDLGGSLRTPASFCSVVGLRPSPGLVPRGPSAMPFSPLTVEGPMARTVADVALMLDAMAGHNPDDPLSRPAPGTPYVEALRDPARPLRVAFSPDLGATPVERETVALCRAAAERFAGMGCEVVEACTDFTGAFEAIHTLRAQLFAVWMGPLYEVERDRIAPQIVWNIEKGLALTADQVARAEQLRAALFHRVSAFFDDCDLLLCPAATVPPFPVTSPWPEEIDGHILDSYVDWISITFVVTLTACPALSLPCGFTESGLPVGLQMVGRPRGEAALLAAAGLLEDALGISGRVPLDPEIRHRTDA